MKKLALVLTAVALLAGNSAHAQTSQPGMGAKSAGTYASDNFAWGIGLGALVIVGVVVGVTAAAASSSPSSFVH